MRRDSADGRMGGALGRYRCWVFDLDGTLTVHQHDFEAIRAQQWPRLTDYRLGSLHELLAAFDGGAPDA